MLDFAKALDVHKVIWSINACPRRMHQRRIAAPLIIGRQKGSAPGDKVITQVGRKRRTFTRVIESNGQQFWVRLLGKLIRQGISLLSAMGPSRLFSANLGYHALLLLRLVRLSFEKGERFFRSGRTHIHVNRRLSSTR
jgi:hypothetical protein